MRVAGWTRGLGWALRRLVVATAAVLVLLGLVFVGAQGLTDPVTARLGPDASAQEVAGLRAQLGLDDPFIVRAARSVADVARGDFGTSEQLSRPAGDIVGPALRNTLSLAVRAAPLAVLGGLIIGAGVTLVELRLGHRFAGLPLLAVQSVPSFVVSVLVIQLLAVRLGVAAPSGTAARPLAVLVLASVSAGQLALLLNDRLHELTREPYVLAALARGQSRMQVVRHHLLRPACVQLASFATLEVGFLLGGALVVETVFGYPGLGRVAVNATEFRDLPVLLAAAATSAAAFLAVRFLGDLALLGLDPRVRDGVQA